MPMNMFGRLTRGSLNVAPWHMEAYKAYCQGIQCQAKWRWRTEWVDVKQSAALTFSDVGAQYRIKLAEPHIQEVQRFFGVPSFLQYVGETQPMPGTPGFTIAVFKSSDVPPGTELYKWI